MLSIKTNGWNSVDKQIIKITRLRSIVMVARVVFKYNILGEVLGIPIYRACCAMYLNTT